MLEKSQMASYIPRLKSYPTKTGWSILLGFALTTLQLSAAESAPKTAEGWSYNRDAGFFYEAGETRLQLWGFAERLFGKEDYAAWRRFRQGTELDLPTFSDSLRPAFVYEIDAANNNFFESGRASKALENAYIAIQDKDDPGRLRLLFGKIHMYFRVKTISRQATYRRSTAHLFLRNTEASILLAPNMVFKVRWL